MLLKLVKRFSLLDSSGQLQRNVSRVVKLWLQRNYYFRDLVVDEMLQEFVQSNQTSPSTELLIGDILKELENHQEKFKFPENLTLEVPNEIPLVAELWRLPINEDPKLLAEQLTLIDLEIYSCILPIELLEQAWSKDKCKAVAQNTIDLMERADHISHWVACCILLQPNLKERIKIITRFIQLAQNLQLLNNFNSMMGIYAGLNLSAVSRLKHSFEGLQPNVVKVFQSMGELLAPMSSFKTLREKVEECGDQVLPFIALHLSDITFTEEGNPDTVVDEFLGTVLINITKHEMIYKCIDSFLRYQRSGDYSHLTPNETIYSLLKQLPKLNSQDLYLLSLEREPRGALVKDLE
eukprot:TRINITY_DN9551_c0_g1_i1.p1 TRINITY_DN9551_c0_g1~~TRINITY_DN9551_c0_g1_i1.p1  ORF type:complete len:351 (+),score=75.14 TRINITY_DN9551_c0_g1_i1:193-1245(+)